MFRDTDSTLLSRSDRMLKIDHKKKYDFSDGVKESAIQSAKSNIFLREEAEKVVRLCFDHTVEEIMEKGLSRDAAVLAMASLIWAEIFMRETVDW